MAHKRDTCLPAYKHLFTPDLLAGQVAFVTGGGSGIGFRISELLLRHGCAIAIASRSKDRVEAAGRLLEAGTGGVCLPLQLDVRDYDQVKAAIAATLARFGRLDIVINGAAGNFLSAAAALSSRAFRTVFEIDALGTFHVCHAAYTQWLASHGGTIINITATLDFRGDPMQTHAGAAKAAINAMTRHLAREWGPAGVRVNSIAPGPIEGTEGYDRLGGFMPASALDKYKKSIPAQRLGTKSDIGHSVLYLASDAGSYVTGTVLVVDGGAWMADVGIGGVTFGEGEDTTGSGAPRSKL